MDFMFKIGQVNFIQFIIVLMIAPSLCYNADDISATSATNSCDCAIVGSHEGEIGPNGEIFDPEIKSSMKLPWKVEIEGTEENMNRHDCEGTLISNKHVLTTASCALQGMAPMTLRAERNSSSLPYIRARFTRRIVRDVSKIYVHKKFNLTPDYDIAILELRETIFLEASYIYPVILPKTPLAVHHGNQLHVAIGNQLHVGKNVLERMNVSIWSKDDCAENEDHWICIPRDNCDLDYPDMHIHPLNSYMENFDPIFHATGSGKREILGIPMGCKSIESPEPASAIIYLRVAYFMPWIRSIMNNCGSCAVKTEDALDAIIFDVKHATEEDRKSENLSVFQYFTVGNILRTLLENFIRSIANLFT